MRVGYGAFPPYTILDETERDPDKRLKGFSVDLVNEIAKRQSPPLKVEWEKMNWETMKADMLSKKFDFVADPVYQTVPRAFDYCMAEPYSYFGLGIGVVRKNDNRFSKFEDLDRPDITIALAEGWSSTEFARQRLKRPKFRTIVVGGDAYTQLDDVLIGRADVALNDSPTIAQYVKAHHDKVKALWLESPPSIVPGGFASANGERDLMDFLNTSLRVLKADGTIDCLDKKWNSYGYIERSKFVPGKGLEASLSVPN